MKTVITAGSSDCGKQMSKQYEGAMVSPSLARKGSGGHPTQLCFTGKTPRGVYLKKWHKVTLYKLRFSNTESFPLISSFLKIIFNISQFKWESCAKLSSLSICGRGDPGRSLLLSSAHQASSKAEALKEQKVMGILRDLVGNERGWGEDASWPQLTSHNLVERELWSAARYGQEVLMLACGYLLLLWQTCQSLPTLECSLTISSQEVIKLTFHS